MDRRQEEEISSNLPIGLNRARHPEFDNSKASERSPEVSQICLLYSTTKALGHILFNSVLAIWELP